jgi:hypothetical protein
MAKFGKRFRKARDRRQQRRADAWKAFQTGRTERVQARQEGKSTRSGYRNVRKADVVRSKADGGYFLPQSVQARQDTIGMGLNLATKAGMVAMGLPPIGGLGIADGGQSSPYGASYSTSGFEEMYYDPTSQRSEEQIIAGVPNELLYVAGGGLLLYLLTRKK